MKVLKSQFRVYIQDMIAYKAAMGYSPSSYEYSLQRFDEHCYLRFPNETNLTRELVETWVRRSENETINSLHRRLAAVREFGRYLQSIGLPAYIAPAKMTAPQTRYVPHIFTDRELALFFRSTDNCGAQARDPLAQYITPVIFRIMYCCGLRPPEGRLIKTEDVDLESGKVYIRAAKRHKDRVVLLSDDVLSMCRAYNRLRENMYGPTEYFFPDKQGQARNEPWILYQFHKCCRIVGVTEFADPPPRIYDFRHTFATKKLHDWMDAGEDLYSLFPYLSAYMGHSSFSFTAYYIHLLPERLNNSSAVDWQKFSTLLPEVQ